MLHCLLPLISRDARIYRRIEMAQEQDHASEEIMTDKANGNLQQAANHGQCENPRGDMASEGPMYPTGLRLVFIFVALCLTVFLVALVSIQEPNNPS